MHIAKLLRALVILAALFPITSENIYCAEFFSGPGKSTSSKKARLRSDSILHALQNGSFQLMETRLPVLSWDAVPRLLSMANRTQTVTLPVASPVNAYYQKQYPLGLVALWMVEAIRLNDGSAPQDGLQSFPSNCPLLYSMQSSGNTMNRRACLRNMDAAAAAYRRWWKQYQNDPKLRCSEDPLDGLPLSWQRLFSAGM